MSANKADIKPFAVMLLVVIRSRWSDAGKVFLRASSSASSCCRRARSATMRRSL